MFGGCCLLLVASFVDFIVLSTTNLVSTKQPFMLSASYSHTKCLRWCWSGAIYAQDRNHWQKFVPKKEMTVNQKGFIEPALKQAAILYVVNAALQS